MASPGYDNPQNQIESFCSTPLETLSSTDYLEYGRTIIHLDQTSGSG
jgi:hypothetical protein